MHWRAQPSVYFAPLSISNWTRLSQKVKTLVEFGKKITFSGFSPLRPRGSSPPLSYSKILSLNLNIGVDAGGPETDFTIKKKTEKVVTKWSLSGH